MTAITDYLQQLGQQAKLAAKQIATASDQQKSQALRAMATQLRIQQGTLIQANQLDLQAAQQNGLSAPLLDRLALSPAAIEKMANGLEQIANMPDPIGMRTETKIMPNGIQISRMRVPIGVIGIIYESRPNVTIDAAALCLKSGNSCILRGGSEAINSNLALAQIISTGLQLANLPANTVQIVNTTDRAAVDALVTLNDYVDVIIPRGGKGLVERISKIATVPTIKHLDGNCHIYVDQHADLDKALNITINAKTFRYGICGALETLLVHQSQAALFLPKLDLLLKAKGVEIRGCPLTLAYLPDATPATTDDWYTEYLAPILAIRIVESLPVAIAHIAQYGSEHTDSIITENLQSADIFQRQVDSSSVYVNLPTCFADGFEYGLGAEIGISTNKLHARGPVGLEGLTTQKWILLGNGQTRS